MKRSVDFTVPLFKWDASHLQGCFYTSIKVDPMVSCYCMWLTWPRAQALHPIYGMSGMGESGNTAVAHLQ